MLENCGGWGDDLITDTEIALGVITAWDTLQTLITERAHNRCMLCWQRLVVDFLDPVKVIHQSHVPLRGVLAHAAKTLLRFAHTEPTAIVLLYR